MAADIGFEWHPNIYPRAVHLSRITENGLRDIFGCWPLPLKKRAPLKKARSVKEKEIDRLIVRYRAIGVGRDRLPYSPQMNSLTRQFNDATGHQLTEGEVWRLLIDRLKRGGGRLKPQASTTTGVSPQRPQR